MESPLCLIGFMLQPKWGNRQGRLYLLDNSKLSVSKTAKVSYRQKPDKRNDEPKTGEIWPVWPANYRGERKDSDKHGEIRGGG